MGKAARRKRKDAPAESIHEAIAREAKATATAPFGVAPAEAYPALQRLLKAARAEVYQSAPRHFSFEGKTYWCRVSHPMTLLEVFDSATSSTPVARTVCGSSDEFGHQPSH
jgi:hypothetical protein